MFKLKGKIPELRQDSSNGEGYLKSYQNNEQPLLDLLIRESIQNSLDASLATDEDEDCVVDLRFKEFSSEELMKYFDSSLGEELNKRYRNEPAYFIEIRDTGTTGLDGPVSSFTVKKSKDHGNYWKLIFDHGIPQSQSLSGHAGGSYGYGKAVYFRAGLGLVIFYSQVQISPNQFQHRLIVALNESHLKEDSLLSVIQQDNIGRAWWGEKNPDNEKELEILPVTDKEKIKAILQVFGLEPFPEEVTGTSIIIPYVSEKELLRGIIPADSQIDENELAQCDFRTDVCKYMKLAVQKWYAPRLNNQELKNISAQKSLEVYVNDEPLMKEDFDPIFLIVQELYNSALSKNYSKNYISERYPSIKVPERSINSARIRGRNVGSISYIKMKANEVCPNYGVRPQTFLRMFNYENEPILMFARPAGMVLNYQIAKDGNGRLMSTDSNADEIVFIFYVPKCDVLLNDDIHEYGNWAFGEYLRKCEKADHFRWEDLNDLRIITNIFNNIGQCVSKELNSKKTISAESKAARIGVMLGNLIFPQKNDDSKRRKKSSGSTNIEFPSGYRSKNKFKFTFEPSSFLPEGMEMSFIAVLPKDPLDVVIRVIANDGGGKGLSAKKWQDEFKGTLEFPFVVSGVTNCHLRIGSSDLSIENMGNRRVSIQDYNVEIEPFFENNWLVGFRLQSKLSQEGQLTGNLLIKSMNKTYECSLEALKE